MHIKVIRACGASGNSLEAGRIYSVPGEVSEKDASALIRMGKAEACQVKKSAEAAGEKKKPRVADGVF